MNDCDLDHGYCEEDFDGCFYCKEKCVEDTYITISACQNNCDLEGSACNMNDDECYECEESCASPKTRLKSDCEKECDLAHNKCKLGEDYCYSCEEVCPDDTYLMTFDDDGDIYCNNECAIDEGCEQPDPPCWKCMPIDCDDYCDSQWDFVWIGENVDSFEVCQAKEEELKELKTCHTACITAMYYPMTERYRCCCLKQYWIACSRCPGPTQFCRDESTCKGISDGYEHGKTYEY